MRFYGKHFLFNMVVVFKYKCMKKSMNAHLRCPQLIGYINVRKK